MSEQKTYMVCVNDVDMAFLHKVMPGFTFVEIRGMGMKDNKDFNLIASPIPKPAEPAPVTEEVKAE